MSALPSNRKSPEELARLRASLGIPEGGGMLRRVGPPEAAAAPAVAPVAVPQAGTAAGAGEATEVVGGGGRRVRSLKRSEREGGPVVAPVGGRRGGGLPGQRHTAAELMELRRREAAEVLRQGGYAQPRAASMVWLVLGYGLAVGGAMVPMALKGASVAMQSPQMGMALNDGYNLLVPMAALAVGVAGWIYFKRTLSRHHAAFMAMVALLALVFSILHYIPQLRYGA